MKRLIRTKDSNKLPSKDKEMVSGVANLIKQVRDIKNRKEIGEYAMKDFEKEDVTYNKEDFKKKARLLKKGGKPIYKHQDGGEAKTKASIEKMLKYVSNDEKHKNKRLNTIQQILESNKDKNFVQRILTPDPNLNIDFGNGEYATHRMSYAGDSKGFIVYPNVVQDKETGELKNLEGTGRDGKWGAADYAYDNNEFIRFDTEQEAIDFTENYKKYWDSIGVKHKQGGSIKDSMSCGEIRKSTREGKKIMKLVCNDGKKKLIHAGSVGYSDFTKHKDKERRKNFHARHNCKEAKPGTPKHLACTELW